MTKKIFVDSDIVLDVLCKRDPYYEYAAKIFSLADMKKLTVYTTSLVVANVYYILRKAIGIEKSKEALRKLRLLVKIISVEEREVDLALNSSFSDFEDALQYFSAVENQCEYIITRNIEDYKNAEIKVLLPEEFIGMF